MIKRFWRAVGRLTLWRYRRWARLNHAEYERILRTLSII
jgi:hypothetical protein